jgi:type IV pilus assembly protein PilX
MSHSTKPSPSKQRQRGATLFIALTILVLLTLLALSAAQVTGLQERMSGIYRADNAAFQAAEDVLRDSERSILDNPIICDTLPEEYLPDAWFDGSVDLADSSKPYVRIENLNNSGSESVARGIRLQGSAKYGADNVPGGEKCLVFRVSSLQGDSDTEATSRSVVQSIFIP